MYIVLELISKSYVTVWAKTSLVRTYQYFEKYQFKNSIKNNQPCIGSGDIHWA